MRDIRLGFCHLQPFRRLDHEPGCQETSVRIHPARLGRGLTRRPRFTFSSSPSSSQGEKPVVPSGPDGAFLQAVRSIAQTTCGIGALLSIEGLVKFLLEKQSLSFPPSLAGMIALFGFLLLLHKSSASRAAQFTSFFAPASGFISRWLAVLFCPVLVVLPLAPLPPPSDVGKLAIVIVLGLILSTLTTAYVSLGLSSLATPRSVDESKSSSTKPAPWVPSPLLLGTLLFATVGGLICAPTFGVASIVASLSATLLGFALAQRLPSNVKRVAHPLLVAVAFAGASIAALALVTQQPWKVALRGYLSQGKGPAGAGDFLMRLLGPAIVSFAFQMFGRRRLMGDYSLTIFGSTLFASAASLFGSALAGRALNIGESSRLLLVPRMVTTPLAICIAESLGTEAALVGSIVSLTGLLGANGCLAMLDACGIKDPVARGLATGSSAHGLGTASAVDEPSTFAVAAIAYALVGTFSTALISIPAVRRAIILTAFG